MKEPRHPAESDRPIAVAAGHDMLWVMLADGRVIGVPLERYPWLDQATPEQRRAVEFTDQGIHWPEAGESLSLADIMSQ